MPKYKYVDGVKYRVVPQSVLGYALVREGSDNSLPSGGTEGQVLAKASNTDYDVEWSTLEIPVYDGAEVFLIELGVNQQTMGFDFADSTKIAEYYQDLEDGKVPLIYLNIPGFQSGYFCPFTVRKESDSQDTYTYTVTAKPVDAHATYVEYVFIDVYINSAGTGSVVTDSVRGSMYGAIFPIYLEPDEATGRPVLTDETELPKIFEKISLGLTPFLCVNDTSGNTVICMPVTVVNNSTGPSDESYDVTCSLTTVDAVTGVVSLISTFSISYDGTDYDYHVAQTQANYPSAP